MPTTYQIIEIHHNRTLEISRAIFVRYILLLESNMPYASNRVLQAVK